MDAQMGSPDFWNSQEKAQQHIAKLNSLKRAVLPVVDFHKKLGDVDVMVELIDAAEGAEKEQYAAELDQQVAAMVEELDKLEIASFLTGQFDKNNRSEERRDLRRDRVDPSAQHRPGADRDLGVLSDRPRARTAGGRSGGSAGRVPQAARSAGRAASTAPTAMRRRSRARGQSTKRRCPFMSSTSEVQLSTQSPSLQ